MWAHAGQSFICKVSHINYIENYDAAVFTVRAPEEAPAFPGAMSLDLKMPEVGSNIGVLAHKLDSEPSSDSEVILKRGFLFLLGTVSEGATIDRKKQQFSFETTVPILPGLSGAPIVSAPLPGQPISACGVVSSDFSPAEAFKDFAIEGSSHGAALWPSAGLGFEMKIEGKLQSPALIGDLLKGGYLITRSKDVNVTINPQGQRMQIIYTDTSNNDAPGIVLETTGHPLHLK
jgi:hypothetical protein